MNKRYSVTFVEGVITLFCNDEVVQTWTDFTPGEFGVIYVGVPGRSDEKVYRTIEVGVPGYTAVLVDVDAKYEPMGVEIV